MARSVAARVAYVCLLGIAAVMPLVPPGETLVASKGIVYLVLACTGVTCLLFDALVRAPAPALGTPTDLALAAFFAAAVPSALLAGNPGMARYQAGELLATALTCVLAVKTLRTPRDVRWLLAAVLASALAISVMGLLGYRSFVAAGAPEIARSSSLATPVFAHSYLAAQYLVMVFAGGLVLLYERGLSGVRRLAVAAALLPMGAFLLVIGSRGAYLAVLCALAMHLLLRARAAGAVPAEACGAGSAGSSPDGCRPADARPPTARPTGARVAGLLARAAVFSAVALAALLLATVSGLLPGAASHAVERILIVFDPQASDFNFSRLRIWADTLRLAGDHLLFGVGLGGYDTLLPSYHYSTRPVPHAHNQFLHVLAELGLVGLIAFLFVLRHALHAVRKGAALLERDGQRRPAFHAAVTALCAALVYFVFETPLKWPEAGSLIMILLAIVTRAGCVSRERPGRPVAAAAGLLALAATLGVAYPTWISHGRASALSVQSAVDEAAARAAQARGDADGARVLMEKALAGLAEADSEFPWRTNLLAHRAELLFAVGRLPEALQDSERAVARQPGNFRTLTALGVIQTQLGHPELAIEPLRGAISANRGPEAAETYLALGRAYYDVQRYEEAWFVFSDLLGLYYQEVRPRLLLDAVRTLLNLDRNLSLARQLLQTFREKEPEADPAYVAELEEAIDRQASEPRRALGPY